MKDTIKELLDELIPEKIIIANKRHLKEAYVENRRDATTTSDTLLHWLKAIQNENILLLEPDTKDQLILEDLEIPRFKDFFARGEALNTIFILDSNKVTYNKDLSQEEIQEILEYVDEMFKILVRKRNIQKWI